METMLIDKVIIHGTVYPLAEKGACGFVSSGQSFLGAIQCTADETKVKCHECGQLLSGIGRSHLHKHSLSARDYKLRHGLGLKTSLLSPQSALNLRRANPSLRERFDCQVNGRPFIKGIPKSPDKLHRTTTPEHDNLRMACMVQLTVRLTNMYARLGHRPTQVEMRSGDEFGAISYWGIQHAFKMTVREALDSIGLTARSPRGKIADQTRMRILQMRARGHSYAEICRELAVCERTIWRTLKKSDIPGSIHAN